MSKKIYVKNLNFTTTEEQLKDECTRFGQVSDVRIITDRETGRSRGFGFVTFGSDDEAKGAIDGLNGLNFYGRTLKVEEAIDKKNSSQSFAINS